MNAPFDSPSALVQAVQRREHRARDQLCQLLRAPVTRLMEDLARYFHLESNSARLTAHALHAAETWVRTRSSDAFDGISWTAFRGAVLLYLAKQAAQPFGQQTDAAPVVSQSLPPSPLYRSETLYLPHQRLGNYWFGGDWLAGREATDGSLWVLLADVTGHGYSAYLLACGLPHVWRACWVSAPPTEPADLLAAMHDILQDCLPDGVFVECTLVRLDAGGGALVAPAGGSRLLLRRGTAGPDLLQLRGTWLGLRAPSAADQRVLLLAEDDELALGTDGLFDQLTSNDRSIDVEQLAKTAQPNFFQGVRMLLEQALRCEPQKDDITLVVLGRRSAARRQTDAPSTAGHVEAHDV
jgi:hypothetical protein